jgi:hypothetical protein
MKLLVIASEPFTSEQLRGAVEDHDDLEVLVMAPALHRSALRFWMSDADDAISEAEDVQRQSVEQLQHEGIDARGDTAESTVPEAIEDALVTFPAERILLFTHDSGDEQYGEHVELDELADRLGLPVERHAVTASEGSW